MVGALMLGEPCVKPLTYWIRSYSLDGEFSEWVSFEDLSMYSETPPLSLSLEPDGLSWTASSTPAVGDYHLYIQRNGALYYEGVVAAEFVSANTEVTPWVDVWTTPTSYEPFFDFAPGDYKVWIRNQAGESGPWSEPLTFSVEP